MPVNLDPASPSDNGRGDVLIHEAYSQATYDKVAPEWQAYRSSSRHCGSDQRLLSRRHVVELAPSRHRLTEACGGRRCSRKPPVASQNHCNLGS
jgi:hypothetical protein